MNTSASRTSAYPPVTFETRRAQDAADRRPSLPRSRSAALLTLCHFAFFVVTLVVLSAATGWPEVLRLPAAEVFDRIRAAALANSIGYFSYLVSSVLMVPLAFVLRDSMQRGGLSGWWIDALAFLGATAGVLKSLGIVRWLLAMPALAEQHA